jgi:hypothetical protein
LYVIVGNQREEGLFVNCIAKTSIELRWALSSEKRGYFSSSSFVIRNASLQTSFNLFIRLSIDTCLEHHVQYTRALFSASLVVTIVTRSVPQNSISI